MSDLKADDDVPKDTELNQHEVNDMPSAEQEEQVIKKKYGGIVPKKPPLISKDHERAFFDSADWALGKQGGHAQKPKGPLEALRPKLQPTQQQVRSRRSAYASTENEDGSNAASEGADDGNDNTHDGDQ
ncbi:hypothetical protein Cni_G04359 [Canna indica]|uniref:Endosulphine n=1 Tax=Canna indica TaxID=4628 RepID=A0AAQ3JTC9_9LILI|nr:hypothetical protein Cni_G04359 [Canna indica]